MATFTITAANTNIDSLTSKTGGDVYNINGGQLVIDQDSRYGQNQSTSASLAAMTISATLGGEILIDGTAVRLIPYNTGAGVVPAAGTTISQGGVSGKLIGVWGSLTSAPTAAGAAMPATGFIKIKQKTGGNYAAGALTGISASATGADTVGWIELVGDEAATCTVPRLGTFRVTGDWYELGTTNGAANQQLQIPTSGSSVYIPGIYIEKTAGSGIFEFYANAASQTSVATDIRAKVCYISTAGLVRIGHNGTANAGYVPSSGLRVVIPNVIMQNCTTAARTANALPNATLATRYDFTTSGGGVIDIDKACMAWYLSFAQPFSVELTNTCTLEQISITECASPVNLQIVGVGQTAAQAQVALILGTNLAGVQIIGCHFSRATLAASGAYTATITGCEQVTIQNDTRFTALTVKGNATSGNILATRVNNSTWSDLELINGRVVLVTCNTITINGITQYCDVITGTTNSTAAQQSYIYELQSSCLNIVISADIDFFGITNVQPYLGILNIAAAGCTNIKLRGIGTRATPLNLGSTNNSAYLLVLAAGATANNVKVQRCYVSSTRTGLWTGDNSSTNITFENVAGDYADAPVTPTLNTYVKAMGATQAVTAQTAVYGTHWFDVFTSTSAGRLGIMMNEETATTADQVTLYNNANFTSAGGLYMPTVGMYAEFELPYFCIGHESFQNSALVMGGGTVGNYRFEYAIDLNDGNGWSAWSASAYTAAALATALNGLTLDATVGFKIRLRITTTTTNSTAITSVYLLTDASTTAQDYQYPLDPVDVTFSITNVDTGSEVVLFDNAFNELKREVLSGNQFDYNYTHTGTDLSGCTALIWKNNRQILRLDNLELSTTDQAIPVFQAEDLVYTGTYTGNVTVDFSNSIIIMDPAATTYDVQAVYSYWKDQVLVGSNAQYNFAFSIVGGNTTSAPNSIPFYTFLENGWKVRPDEADHTLSVVSGILLSADGTDPFIDTIGAYTVRINFQQPVQAIAVSTSGGGGASAADVWAYASRTLTAIGSSGIASESNATSNRNTVQADIAALNDISSADITAALNSYDVPTKTELDGAEADIIAAIPTAAVIADAVLDETVTGRAAGSLGKTVKDAADSAELASIT